MFQQFIFYLFTGILIASAIGVVTVRNPIYAALCLIVAFFSSAAIWVLSGAEFLGVVLVLVYVGAVMVLFLFVIMMLDLNIDLLKQGFIRYLPIGLGAALIITVEMILVLNMPAFKIDQPLAALPVNNTEALGEILYTDYAYPFEVAALILVLAIVAAIVLTLRRRTDVKSQNVAEQIQVRRHDRVRLIKMQAEKQT